MNIARSLILTSMITLGLAVTAYAQGEVTPKSPTQAAPEAKTPPPGFAPVAGARDVDKVDPSPLVIAAYATFFVLMFGYVIFVAREQKALSKELEDVAAALKKS